jgi:hypothetical protein
MDTRPDYYNFVFTVPLPLVVNGGKTLWKLSANTYGKGHGQMEVIAQCIKGPETRIVIIEGREGPTVRIYRMGMTCYRGTTLDRIVRKLVHEGRAEIVS